MVIGFIELEHIQEGVVNVVIKNAIANDRLDKDIHGWMHWIDWHTYRQRDRQTERQIDIWIDRSINR